MATAASGLEKALVWDSAEMAGWGWAVAVGRHATVTRWAAECRAAAVGQGCGAAAVMTSWGAGLGAEAVGWS